MRILVYEPAPVWYSLLFFDNDLSSVLQESDADDEDDVKSKTPPPPPRTRKRKLTDGMEQHL